MPQVTLEEAQQRLPELIEQLALGEELVITQNGRPLARLTREPPADWSCQPGSAKDTPHRMADDFNAPLDLGFPAPADRAGPGQKDK
jgi:antitoxin (DNA-binding transcriptional repressor) of toxin-antitoxin stability system